MGPLPLDPTFEADPIVRRLECRPKKERDIYINSKRMTNHSGLSGSKWGSRGLFFAPAAWAGPARLLGGPARLTGHMWALSWGPLDALWGTKLKPKWYKNGGL